MKYSEKLLKHVQYYGKMGLQTFPCKPRGKVPATAHGCKDATTDPGQIAAWWNGIHLMNDYGRKGPAEGQWSRYGAVASLDATTEELTLKKDRSFTFAIDKLDTDETARQLAAASALAWS